MSDAEEALAFQLKAVGISFEREVVFAPPRKWRADFVTNGTLLDDWTVAPLLIEVDGGSFVAGRHTSGTGFEKDAEKLNAATLLGYRILRFTPHMIDDGRALATIEKALGRLALHGPVAG